MTDSQKETEQATETAGVFGHLWRNKIWWLLPLAVLLLLIAMIYVLGHLSAADPETYPTTLRQCSAPVTRC